MRKTASFRYATSELSTLSGAENIYSRIQDTANKLCVDEYGGFRLVTHAAERERCVVDVVRELVTENQSSTAQPGPYGIGAGGSNMHSPAQCALILDQGAPALLGLSAISTSAKSPASGAVMVTLPSAPIVIGPSRWCQAGRRKLVDSPLPGRHR